MTHPWFEEIVSGWMLIDGMEDITMRIESVGFMMRKFNITLSDLDEQERKTLEMMIESQIARGIARGDFAPYL